MSAPGRQCPPDQHDYSEIHGYYAEEGARAPSGEWWKCWRCGDVLVRLRTEPPR